MWGEGVREGGRGARGGAADLRGPTRIRGSPQQHWPCQRMPVIRRLTEVIPWLSPAMQQAPLLSATLKEDGGDAEERAGAGGGALRGWGWGGWCWCPFFSPAL